ncbi:MAG: flagellar hook protein FlgE [Sedimentisphaerales bacterium]
MGALAAGVSGLQAHQKMLDVAGNNLANVNTTAYKSSRITFSELLSETVKKASQPTATMGGTNPQQLGSGVGISGISPNMNQGNIESTGNPLDLAIEGEGYFVLSDGGQAVYTRAGAFAVDANSNLVDPSTGFLVQRIGSVGESDGFQIAGDNNIKVPYDVAMAAKATESVTVSGNLSSDSVLTTPNTNVLISNLQYTTTGGTAATSSSTLVSLEQWSGTATPAGTITISGIDPDGTAYTTGLTLAVSSTTTVGDLVDQINTALDGNATASLVNGKIKITDDESGYSKSDLNFTYSGTGALETPGYFEISTVGGEEVKSVNITMYDSQGGSHVLAGAFVRTDTANTWDLVLTSVSGNVNGISMADRRVEGIEFDAADGSYSGLNSTIGDDAEFVITFAHDTANPQTIDLSLGTAGQLDGLTQFAGNSTAVAREQDGYEAGRLSSVSVNNEGIVIGAFSNGIKKQIATVQIALFQNAAGLESAGGGYYTPSANSGEAVATQALTGGAGSLHGSSLEKSNADVASEFVNLIQAQNGYQANARTITVANDILKELTNLIR